MQIIKVSSRAAILEAAFQLFSERPTASLGDVAARAGVGRATLHRHFPSREALMETLALTALDEIEAAVEAATAHEPSPMARLRLSMAAVVPLATRQWFLAQEPVAQAATVAAAYAADRAMLAAEIEAAQAAGALTTDAPVKWIAETYDALTFAAWTLVRDGDATPAQAADLAWRTFTTGLELADHD